MGAHHFLPAHPMQVLEPDSTPLSVVVGAIFVPCSYLVFRVHLMLYVPQILNIADELLPVLCFMQHDS